MGWSHDGTADCAGRVENSDFWFWWLNMSIPLVYALTYAVLKVADMYFSHQSKNEKLCEEHIKAVWKEAFIQGKKHAKKNQAHRQAEND